MYMKKLLAIAFVSILFLSSCSNSADHYISWTDDATENNIQRLDEANIKYEIREGQIWIRERDLDKAVMCCS